MEIEIKPIGIVHSPFKKIEDIEPGKYAYARGFDSIQGELEIFKEFEDGLKILYQARLDDRMKK